MNREIPVRVLFETSPGKMEVVAEQKIQATADGQLLPIQFEYVPQTPGEFKLTLEAVPQPGELVTTNNRLSTFVNVLKGGLNVLYLEGTYRVEQKFIRRALDASPDIHVDYVRLDARDKPGDLRDRFKPGKYDVYLLGDIDSSAFSAEELNDLGRGRQSRGGPDDARRIPQFRRGRIRRNAAQQSAAGRHGSPRSAAARRADPQGFALARPACKCGPR